MIRLEGYGAGIALEPYSIPARVKHLATNCELYSICRQAQKGFFVRRTLESFVERRAPGGRDHRGSEEPLKAGVAVCVDPDRGPIVDPGTMTCVTQDGVALLLPDDLFSDEPRANDACKFRCLLGTDPGVEQQFARDYSKQCLDAAEIPRGLIWNSYRVTTGRTTQEF
jgi:hypothetical protein